MQLLILTAASLAAVGLIAALNGWLARGRVRRLAGADEAAALWRLDFPDDEPIRVETAADGRAALLRLPPGRGAGLLFAVGDDWVSRRVRPGGIARAEARGEDELLLALRDYTAPRIRLRLPNTQRAAWQAALTGAAAASG